jgi:TonB family protein
MRRWTRLVVLVVCTSILLVSSPPSRAQQEQSESKRKMVTRIVPLYPSLAQKMGITGSVKIEAQVASNGTVKSAGILGGHPVLALAGVDAVRKCKWEPASHETREVVVFNFHPE